MARALGRTLEEINDWLAGLLELLEIVSRRR